MTHIEFLFDKSEENLNIPSSPVSIGNFFGREFKVVGYKPKFFCLYLNQQTRLNEGKKPGASDEEVNLSILEKVKLIDTLEKEEKNCLLKMIDIAIAKKRMKDNLVSIMND